MKAIYKHIAFAALALSAVACSQEDDFSPSYLSDPDAVRITAQVGTADVSGGFTRSNPVGTVEEQAKFNTGDQISVTAGTQAPVTYQLGEDGWNPVGETYLKWQTNEMNVTAYYPVVEGASATTFTVPTGYNVSADIAKADYMTYSGKQTKGDDKSINLEMQRKMVRIVIDEIHFNDQFPEDVYSVDGITVHANTKGYVDGEPEAGNISVTAYHESDGFYALLAPTIADDEATFLTVTVNNGSTSQVLTVKGIPATTAGNSYSFSLTVGKDKASIKEPVIKDWNTGGVIDVTNDEMEKETLYTYENGTYNVYMLQGLEAAIEAAGTTASTIKLMSALTITDGIRFEENTDITIDLNGSNFTVSTSSSNAVLYNFGKLNIDNCVINNDQGSGIQSTRNSELTIGEKVEVSAAKIAVGMYGNNSTINGGKITGKDALWCMDGNVTINGGTFTATDDEGYVVYGNGADNVSISGGSFTGNIWASESTNLTITGGTFSVNPSDYVDTENYKVTESEGVWIVAAIE